MLFDAHFLKIFEFFFVRSDASLALVQHWLFAKPILLLGSLLKLLCVLQIVALIGKGENKQLFPSLLAIGDTLFAVVFLYALFAT